MRYNLMESRERVQKDEQSLGKEERERERHVLTLMCCQTSDSGLMIDISG